MKSRILVLSISSIFISFLVFFTSCKKINESTQVGDDLIPAVDNVTTFETFLDTETDNRRYRDSITRLLFNDVVALGHIGNDPEFGSTHGNAYFNVSHNSPGLYPFVNKDSVTIDSVILSLAYDGAYGDTNSIHTVRVFEIAQTAGFNDTTLYRFSRPDFATTGGELGSKTFTINQLNDTILHIRKGDTTKLVNVLRIPLSNSLGTRFVNYDTSNSSNGAFRRDSIFKTLFRGVAVQADNSGNALAYFAPADLNTRLTIYFRYQKNGIKDTTAVDFTHNTNGQANVISRTEGGGWAGYLNNANPLDDKLYIPSNIDTGSFGAIRIPALDTFKNAVIHRAELIITKIPSTDEDKFTPPVVLFLDKINAAGDTAFSFDADMNLQFTAQGVEYSVASFGGNLRTDNTYRFTITRHVQGIVTRKEPNYLLRLYAPLRTVIYSKGLQSKISLQVLGRPANGRVVVTGGNYSDPALRVRVRLVWSKISG